VKATLEAINHMQADGIIGKYTIGGGVGDKILERLRDRSVAIAAASLGGAPLTGIAEMLINSARVWSGNRAALAINFAGN